ncbi:MAG: hypothetical protein RRY10_06465, partial [Christensenellaceae bacterium]
DAADKKTLFQAHWFESGMFNYIYLYNFWRHSLKIPSDSISKAEPNGIILSYSMITASFYCLVSLERFNNQ